MNRFWIMPKGSSIQLVKCFVCGKSKSEVSSLTDTIVSFERYELRTPICDDCLKATNDESLTATIRQMYDAGPNVIDTTGLPKPEEDFWKQIDERIAAKKESSKRKIQMDKKLGTWLIETNGKRKEISCREICEQFNDESIITRLRIGIDSGADLSTVELDD